MPDLPTVLREVVKAWRTYNDSPRDEGLDAFLTEHAAELESRADAERAQEGLRDAVDAHINALFAACQQVEPLGVLKLKEIVAETEAALSAVEPYLTQRKP